MTGALVRKELRELRPWAVLSVVFWLFDVVDVLSSSTDARPLGSSFHGFSDVSFLWLLAFAIGTTLGTREADDGTLAFLDGLPVTRSRVFLTKLSVAAGVLLTYPLLKMVLVVGLHFLSRGSLNHDVRAGLLAQVLALEVLLVASGLAFGAALGHLRSLTWLVAGLAGLGLSLLMERLPRAALFDPMALAHLEVLGLQLNIDPEAVVVQTALTVLWAVVAWAGFVGTGRPRFAELFRRPVVGAVLSVLTVVAVVGALAIRADRTEKPGADGVDASEPRFTEAPPAATSTVHYRFSYPVLRTKLALALADDADAVFVEVHQLLQVPLGEPIDVDASGSMRSTAGTAFFGGLRMKLGADARRVLAHETSHVVSRRMAGDERAWLWGQAPVLNEGLASWVERHFEVRDEGRREDDLVLAALHERGELLLEELVDAAALTRARDEFLKYTAGEALIDAMVRLYGVEAVPRLVAAFADQRLPPDLEGLALWQACLQTAGMDLGRVVDDFFRHVEAVARANAAQLAALPRPRVVLLQKAGGYGAKAVVADPLPQGWSLALRFRPGPDSTASSYDTFDVKPGEPAWRADEKIRKAQLCVQAGVQLPHGNTVYEPWACLPLRDAVQWKE